MTQQHNGNINEIVELYTDGSCVNNGKSTAKSGYGIYFPKYPTYTTYGSIPKNEKHTNNRAELIAIQKGIQICIDNFKDNPCLIISDSEYCINSLTIWIDKWKKNGWKTSSKKPILNVDLITNIDSLIQRHGVISFEHVNSHGKNPNTAKDRFEGNMEADRLASLLL